MCLSEASEAAALVRAALARGFTMIGSWSGADMPSAAENERILTHLARQALADAEALRGRRDEAVILAAEAAHAAEAASWRDALRGNALDAVRPKLAAAAAFVGAPMETPARTPSHARVGAHAGGSSRPNAPDRALEPHRRRVGLAPCRVCFGLRRALSESPGLTLQRLEAPF
jgi:hypothetical protein